MGLREVTGGSMYIEVDRYELEYLIDGLKDQLDYYCDMEDQEERDAINRLLARLRAAEMASRARRVPLHSGQFYPRIGHGRQSLRQHIGNKAPGHPAVCLVRRKQSGIL